MGKALPSLFISANFEQMSVCYTNICRRFFVLSMNDDENEWWGSGEGEGLNQEPAERGNRRGNSTQCSSATRNKAD